MLLVELMEEEKMISAPEFVRVRDAGLQPSESFTRRAQSGPCVHIYGPETCLTELSESEWNAIQRAIASSDALVSVVHLAVNHGINEDRVRKVLAEVVATQFEPLREVGVISRISYGFGSGGPRIIITIFGPYELEARQRTILGRVENVAFQHMHESPPRGIRVTH